MRIDCITLFPGMIQAAVAEGIVGRAHERALVETHTWNPRDHAQGNYRRVDDRTAGGGAGMVMMLEPLRQTLQAIKSVAKDAKPHVIHFTPQGKTLNQARVRELAKMDHLVLVCARYEGIDERFVANAVDEEISIGDYVLSGGELAAAVLIDAVTRVQEGAMSDMDSARFDSFEDGLLDHPHYTKPNADEWGAIPPVLLGGNHGEIAKWRRMQQLGRTYLRRPDLLAKLELSAADRQLLEQFIATLSVR